MSLAILYPNGQVEAVQMYVWDGTKSVLWDGVVSNGFDIPTYDFISLAQASTTDTYTYKTGGSGGTTVATVTITYTDSTKATISTVAKT